MFTREMRRKDRELSTEEAKQILLNGKFGVMSVLGDDGYPYGVPLHYVIIGNNLYFHCTVEGGYKIVCLERNPKISFTVVETEDGIKCKSAIFFGVASCVPDKREMVLSKLIEKFVPEVAWTQAKSGIPFSKDKILAYELKIEHITAKYVDKPAGK